MQVACPLCGGSPPRPESLASLFQSPYADWIQVGRHKHLGSQALTGVAFLDVYLRAFSLFYPLYPVANNEDVRKRLDGAQCAYRHA